MRHGWWIWIHLVGFCFSQFVSCQCNYDCRWKKCYCQSNFEFHSLRINERSNQATTHEESHAVEAQFAFNMKKMFLYFFENVYFRGKYWMCVVTRKHSNSFPRLTLSPPMACFLAKTKTGCPTNGRFSGQTEYPIRNYIFLGSSFLIRQVTGKIYCL